MTDVASDETDLQKRRDALEVAVSEMTQPINGQYPRPWMTASTDPVTCRVFTVGMNQRNGFAEADVGTHEHYLDALFNRGPETCRQLYDRLTDKPSPTRKNSDALVARLAGVGITDVLETNVICYSTPMSADLRAIMHVGGKEHGMELFATLLGIVQPRILIVHGSGSAKELGLLLGRKLPEPPQGPSAPVVVAHGQMTIFIIPSLAPPGYNKWVKWSPTHLDRVCAAVVSHL